MLQDCIHLQGVYISEVNVHKHIQQIPVPSATSTTVTKGGPVDVTDLMRKLSLLAFEVCMASGLYCGSNQAWYTMVTLLLHRWRRV